MVATDVDETRMGTGKASVSPRARDLCSGDQQKRSRSCCVGVNEEGAELCGLHACITSCFYVYMQPSIPTS
jgi:hypothetical protein